MIKNSSTCYKILSIHIPGKQDNTAGVWAAGNLESRHLTICRWWKVNKWPEGPVCFNLKGHCPDIWDCFQFLAPVDSCELFTFSRFCLVSLEVKCVLASVFSDPLENCGRHTVYYRELFVRGCNLNPSVCLHVFKPLFLPLQLALYAAAWSCKQNLQSCLSLIVTVGLFL